MKNKLISVLVILALIISTTPAMSFAATLVPVEGFSYDSSNFSELNLDGKTGFSLDSDGNLVMSMQGVRGTGSKVNLGGSGIEGENIQFKMIYRNTQSATAEYYADYSFVRGGGFFDIYKQRNLTGSLQMSTRVINAQNIFTTNYLDTLFYTAVVINMNTVTGEAEYGIWECTSLSQAIAKNDISDTERRTFTGTGTSASGANVALGDIVLNTLPSTAGTSADIIVYNVSLQKLEEVKEVQQFSYDSTNFNTLNLYEKDGFSINEDGNLVMTMKSETSAGSQLALGGNGIESENIRFKMVYHNTDDTSTSQYYDTKSFVRGGGFFDFYKQDKKQGSLQMSSRVVYNNTKLFEAGSSDAPYYNTIAIDMNTVTGEATYAIWQSISLAQALSKNGPDSSPAENRVAYGSGTSKSGTDTALTDIILNTAPSVAGTNDTDVIVYAISLEEYDPSENTDEFKYNSSNFKTLELTDKDGFSLDSEGNLVMSMRSETTAGSQLYLGGNGMEGENVQFKLVYRNTDATATAEYYTTKSFVRGGGFFDYYKQGRAMGSLQMSESVLKNNDKLFASHWETTLFYYAFVVNMNTVTGEADWAIWQCTSLEQALAKNEPSGVDTVRLTANGSGTSAAGADTALTDFILSTNPSVAGTSTDIIIYEASLTDLGMCTISNPELDEADGVVTATVQMFNSTNSDENYALIVVAYGADNNMLDFNYKPITSCANSESTSDFVTLAKPSGATSVKAFVWNTLSVLKPVGTAEPLDGK